MTVNGVDRPYLDFLHWVSLPTLAGLPATVAPVGRTKAGLPVGVQIVGARFEDRSTIEAASWLGGFEPPPDFA
jgi:amidase